MDNRKYNIAKDSISISQFVSQYLNIDTNCKNLRHQGLKSLNSPLVVGVSNEYANKNPELVKKGILLIVLDSRKNKGTYINPIKLRELINKELVDEEIKEISKIRIYNLLEISHYYKKYMEAIRRQEEIEKFYSIIESLNKTDVIDDIKKQEKMFEKLYMIENNSGGKVYDKCKR